MGRSGFALARRWTLAAVLTLTANAVAVVTIASPSAQASENRPPSSPVADPAALVHPLDGTGTGPVTPGTVGEFPGRTFPSA